MVLVKDKKTCVCNKFMVCSNRKKLWEHRKKCAAYKAYVSCANAGSSDLTEDELKNTSGASTNLMIGHNGNVVTESISTNENQLEEIENKKGYLKSLITDHIQDMKCKYCLSQVSDD